MFDSLNLSFFLSFLFRKPIMLIYLNAKIMEHGRVVKGGKYSEKITQHTNFNACTGGGGFLKL